MLGVRVLKVKRIIFLWVALLLSLLSISLLSEKICCDSFCGPKTKSESFSMMSIYFNQVLFSATEIDCHFCLHAQKGSTLSKYVYSENITSIMNNKNYTTVTWVWFLTFVSLVGWVCCWLSSLLWGFFSKFPPFTKTNTPNFNSIGNSGQDQGQLVECPLLNSNFIFPFLLFQSQCETWKN